MANKELDQMRGILSNLDSEATSKPQPSKTMNGGTAKIDGANPSSPSTNPATRREEYSNYIKTLNKDQQQSLYNEVLGYKNQGMSNDQIYDKVLSNRVTTPELKTAQPGGVDLTIKGNFDVYNPVDWQSQPEVMQQYYVQANNDIKESRRTLSQLMLQQEALESKSSNVNQVTTLIDAIENAYDRGVFDAETIAKTLGVDVNTVKLIQQGKANELVKLDQEYVQDQLKSYYRAEEDYDINLQRTMEDYNLAKTNLDNQYNSAMQTLRRNLFDEKRAASVGSAVAGISGSEYAINVIEAKHQQNMDDLEANYLYSSINQKYSYTRAIQDYNKNIQRLSEDFDDSLKAIQAGVLQQFQEIDNKIGLTTAQLAKAYGTLQQNVITAKASAATSYLEALSKNEGQFADALAKIYGIDKNELFPTETNGGMSYTPVSQGKMVGGMNTYIESIADKIAKNGVIRVGNCGEPVNDYLNSLGLQGWYDNNKSTKLNSKNSDTPTVGSIAIWDGSTMGTDATKKYGHVAIVVGVDDKNGTITVLESNVGTGLRYKKYKQSNVYGYFDPSKEAGITTGSGTSDEKRDYSGLTAEQKMSVDKLATELLGATQAKTDVVTHNAIAEMMRQGYNVDQIKDAYRASSLGSELSNYKNTNSIVNFLTSGMTKDKKADFLDAIQDAMAEGDYDAALGFIKSKAQEGMSASARDSLQASENLLEQMDELQRLMNEVVAEGSDTGYLKGTWEEIYEKFGETTDPKLLKLKSKVNQIIMIYRHGITGAAFTESEKNDYEKVFPGIKKDVDVNNVLVDALREKATTDVNYYYGTKMGGTQKYLDLVKEIEDAKAGKTPETKETSSKTGGFTNIISAFGDIYSMLSALNNSAANPEKNSSTLEQDFKDTTTFTSQGIRTGNQYQSTAGGQSNVNTGFQSHMPTGK